MNNQSKPVQKSTTIEDQVMAYDPGFGNAKIVIGYPQYSTKTDRAVLQSAVARPRDIGQAGQGMRTATKATIVTWIKDNQEHEFAVGPNAWAWGEPITSMDYSSLAGPERTALMYTTIAKALGTKLGQTDLARIEVDNLVIGLPVPLMMNEAQFDLTKKSLRYLKGNHIFRIADRNYDLHVKRIKVLAQPVGAYCDWLYNDELEQRTAGKTAEVAVLDIGMNTLDLFVIDGGTVTPRFVGGRKVGVRRLLELVKTTDLDLTEIDSRIRTNKLKITNAQKEIWLGEIMSVVESTWSSIKRFTTVIPTGGGAVLIDQQLRQALMAAGASVSWPEHPILANAIGMWKWGAK